MDNVLVFGKDKEEHDVWLSAVLNRIQEVGVTLNKGKCEFEKQLSWHIWGILLTSMAFD